MCAHEHARISVSKIVSEKIPGMFVFRLQAICAECQIPFEFLGPMDGSPFEPLVRGDLEAIAIECPAVVRGTKEPTLIIPESDGGEPPLQN